MQTAIGAAAGIGGGTLASWMQARSQRRMEDDRSRERAEAEQQQRRERTAEVLADVAAFLIDLDLHWLGAAEFKSAAAQFTEHHRDLEGRHQAVRRPLLTLAVSHPSPTVRRLVRDLERSLSGCLTVIGLAVDNPSGQGNDEWAAMVEETYRKTDRLFTELVDKV